MRVRRRTLTVVFLAIVVGVVLFPDWERWGGKSDREVAQAVAFGADSGALRLEVERRVGESEAFRRNIRAWYLAMAGAKELEKRRLAWAWQGSLWPGDGEALAEALEERIEVTGDDGVRGRLLGVYLEGGVIDADFLVGLLDDAALSPEAAEWLALEGKVPVGEEGRVARVLVVGAGAAVRGAMKAYHEGGVVGDEVYRRWLVRAAKEVEDGDGSCCPGGREERARVLEELEGELGRVTATPAEP